MNHRIVNLRAPVWVFVLLLLVPVAWGSVGGSISGLVTDSTGAVIVGAEVVALNVDTGIRQAFKTDSAGFYSFATLPIGHYQIEVRQIGFKEFRKTGLVIDANSALKVDATLEVGTVTQEVSVSATAVQVETNSTQMGEVIGDSKIEMVPLNGRSYTDLLALQPGVVPVSAGDYPGYSPSGNLNAGNLSVSGQREAANGFMVNGGNVEEGADNSTAIVPNLDSIAEFRIITNDADAEYGNYSGGLVNAITKSGTNQFHGDVFEFLRNSDMDSRNFYSPSRGTLHQNQYGGTFGGPIRHDRLFFFSDYQGTRQVVGVDSGLTPVPSATDHTGNLADVASQLTGTVSGGYWANMLSQKLGYPVSVGEPYYTSGCTSSANCVLPNAVIPASAISPIAQNLLKYIPGPNIGPDYTTSAFDETLRDDKASSRIDANTALGMLSGYYFIDDYTFVNPYSNGSGIPGFSSTNNGRAQNVNFGATKSFSAGAVNEFRLNYTRDVIFTNAPQGGVGPSLSSLGFITGSGTGAGYNGGIVDVGNFTGVPKIGLNNFTIGMAQVSLDLYDNSNQVIDNFSLVKGTHTLKFGGSGHLDNSISYEGGSQCSVGDFGFYGAETGVDFGDFLLGAPGNYENCEAPTLHTRQYYYSLYGQDSWRARPNLTVNLGLNWAVRSPWYEIFGENETLRLGEQSVVFPGAPTGWDFPGDPGVPRTISPVHHADFSPRVGLAYSPSATEGFLGKLIGGPGKTSIRASFGVFFTADMDGMNWMIQGDPPYGSYYASPTPSLFDAPFIDRQTGHSEGAHFPVVFPPRNVSAKNPDSNVNWSQFLPIAGAPVIDSHNGTPYAEHYSLSLQRQLSPNTLMSVSYVGTEGHRQLAAVEANPSNSALCLSLSQPNEVLPGTATCGPVAEDATFYPITGGVVHGTRYPFGSNFTTEGMYTTAANSDYNALEATLRHTSGRMEILAGYTYSKSLDNSSSWGYNGSPTGGDMLNFLNPEISRALSSYDMTHNFVASYSYQVPFEKLWRPNRLTNGWIVTGITHFTTGLPVTLQEYDDHSLLGTLHAGGVGILDVPNYTSGSLNFTNPRLADQATDTDPYFNTSLFSKEALGQLGDANRRFFHGPGLNNWDLSLHKDLRITESMKLEFRGEFFNIFNHAQFGIPTGKIVNSSFGFVTSARDPRIGQVAMKFIF
jgi:hypothetical protein